MRRKFDAKFKSKVALEAAKENDSLRVLAQRFEVQPCQVQQWKKKLLENLTEAFSSKKERKLEDKESLIGELYRQIGQLKVENDFLKKKV